MHRQEIEMNDESRWEELKRMYPETYHTIYRMPEAQESIVQVVGIDYLPDLSSEEGVVANYILLGHLERRLERMQSVWEEAVEAAASDGEARKWKTFAKTTLSVLFKNGVGVMSEVPIEILEIIVNDIAFHGSIRDAGREVEFVREGEVLATVPKSLVDQLRGEGKENR